MVTVTAALSATAYASIPSPGSFKREASGAQIMHSISGHNSKCQPVAYFQVSNSKAAGSRWIWQNSGVLWQCSGNILTLTKMCKVVIQYFSAWFVSTNGTKHNECFWMVRHQTLCARSRSTCRPRIDWYTLLGGVGHCGAWHVRVSLGLIDFNSRWNKECFHKDGQ